MAVHCAAGVGTGCGFGWLPRKTSGSLPAMTLCNVSSSDGVHFSRVSGLTFAGMLAVLVRLQIGPSAACFRRAAVVRERMRQRSVALCTMCVFMRFLGWLKAQKSHDQVRVSGCVEEALCVVAKGSEPSHKKFTQTLRHISLRAREVGGCCAPSLAIERQRWRHSVARRLRNLREPRRERLHQQLSQLAARAFAAGGGRPVRKRLAQRRPMTRFRVRGGGSGTREQRE